MPPKIRIIVVSYLILLGGALFFYCLFFYPIEITTQAKGGSTTVAGSIAAPVKATSVGGAERDKSDQNNRTGSESRPRPKAAAT